MKIEEALAKFLIQLEADGRAESTISQYRRHILLLAHWAHDVGHSGDVNEISHETLAAFLTSPQARTRRGGGVKKATSANCLRSSIKAFFGYLHRAGIIPHDPGRLIRRAICTSPPPRALSEKEATRLMAVLADEDSYEGKRDYALFHLMLATGIRLGSAIALDVDDVDLDAGQIQIRTTKGNRPEQVILGKKITTHLRRYFRDRHTGPLFTNRHGQRLSCRQVQRRFSEWIEKAGIERAASVHCLRHTLGTSLYRRTGDIFLVKEMLRHRSIASTLVYARTNDDQLRSMLAR